MQLILNNTSAPCTEPLLSFNFIISAYIHLQPMIASSEPCNDLAEGVFGFPYIRLHSVMAFEAEGSLLRG